LRRHRPTQVIISFPTIGVDDAGATRVIFVYEVGVLGKEHATDMVPREKKR
jgi:hypothetical protein